MPARKPLVLVSGQMQQLQANDTLAVTGVAGGDVVSQTNDEASPVVICTPVYNDAADGFKKAKSDAAGTSGVIGLVFEASIANGVAGMIQVNGVFSATTGQWDAVFGTTGGLAFGTRYYLSASVGGNAVAAAPSAVGQYVVYLGRAVSTTELLLAGEYSPILL